MEKKKENIYRDKSCNRLIIQPPFLFRKTISWLAQAMMFKCMELLGDTKRLKDNKKAKRMWQNTLEKRRVKRKKGWRGKKRKGKKQETKKKKSRREFVVSPVVLDPEIGPCQALQLQARVELGAMAIKDYTHSTQFHLYLSLTIWMFDGISTTRLCRIFSAEMKSVFFTPTELLSQVLPPLLFFKFWLVYLLGSGVYLPKCHKEC